MASFVDIGKRAGQAAAGEYGNDALLTTPGGLVICNASGVPVQLAPGARGALLVLDSTPKPSWFAAPAANQVPMWNASGDPVAAYMPGHLITDNVGRQVTNPTGGSSLLSGGTAITNGWPAFGAAGDIVEIDIAGVFNMVTSSTVTWVLKAGATAVETWGPNTATTALRPFGTVAPFRFRYLTSTTIQPIAGLFLSRGGTAAGAPLLPAVGDLFTPDMATITISALPQTLDLTATNATGNASSTVTLNSLQVRYYPVGS